MGSKETPMGSKRTSRRELLKGGATLAGGLTLGVPVHAQTHDQHDHHASGPASGSENAYPMIPGNKEMIAYGERSHFVTSVRIPHPIGSKASPDEFGRCSTWPRRCRIPLATSRHRRSTI